MEPDWKKAAALLQKLVKAQDDMLVRYRMGDYGPRGAAAADRLGKARDAWKKWRGKNLPDGDD